MGVRRWRTQCQTSEAAIVTVAYQCATRRDEECCRGNREEPAGRTEQVVRRYTLTSTVPLSTAAEI